MFSLSSAAAAEEYLYDTCYTASDFGNIVQRIVTVTPLGSICDARCKAQCNRFSRKMDDMELNDDIILNCLTACRRGELFFSTVREPSQAVGSFMGFITSSQSYATNDACKPYLQSPENANYSMVSANLSVKTSDTVRLRLTATVDQNAVNEVYLCGWSAQYLIPVRESLNPDSWDVDRMQWQNRDSSVASWHSRNHIFSDTGIYFKNGDFLSITYGGQYFSAPPNSKIEDMRLRVKKAALPFKAYKDQLVYTADDYYTLPGDKVKSTKNSPGMDIEDIAASNKNLFYGLDGHQFEMTTRMGGGLDFSSGSTSQYNGTVNVKSLDTYSRFSGVVSELSESFVRLGLAHDRPNTPASIVFPFTTIPWNKSLGGYYVKIERKGCVYKDGARLFYGIGAKDTQTDPKNPRYRTPTEWYPVDTINLKNFAPISIPFDGILYFSIRPPYFQNSYYPVCTFNDHDCLNASESLRELFEPINAHGQYTVLVERDDYAAHSTDIVSYVIKSLRTYLFGDDSSTGIVQELFVSLLSDSGIVQAVRALMVLYVAFTGLSFMLGIAQFTQKEGIVRMTKLGVLVMLISPGSWNFFSNTFFKFITDGGLELIVRITADAGKTSEEMNDLLADPVRIFEDFNEPFLMLFGRVTWMKVWALMVSTPVGIIVAPVILVAGGIYALCLAKAALLYMISMIGIAVLLTLAPIFISFLLFKYTQQMFEAWWKQLLSLMLQPVLVYSFIFIINMLILICLKTVLGFSICYGCGITLDFAGFGSQCIINWYTMVSAMHMPSAGFPMIMSIISISLIFMILCQALYAFTEWSANLAHMIATSQFQGSVGGAVRTAISQSMKVAGVLTGFDQNILQGSKDLKTNYRTTKNAGGWIKRNIFRVK
jgi:type IV secretion system protein VirB6